MKNLMTRLATIVLLVPTHLCCTAGKSPDAAEVRPAWSSTRPTEKVVYLRPTSEPSEEVVRGRGRVSKLLSLGMSDEEARRAIQAHNLPGGATSFMIDGAHAYSAIVTTGLLPGEYVFLHFQRSPTTPRLINWVFLSEHDSPSDESQKRMKTEKEKVPATTFITR